MKLRIHHVDSHVLYPADFLQWAFTKHYPDIEGDIYTEGLPMEENKPYWAFDNYRSNGTQVKALPLFYTQPGWTKNFAQQYGMDNIKCVTYACEPTVHKHIDNEKIYDVGFVGNFDDPTGERQEQLEFLSKHYKVFISDKIKTEDIAEVYSKCKIIFNQVRNEEINIRFFEGLAMGAQVVTYKPALHLFAEEDKHYVTYATIPELKYKIDTLLVDDERRNIMSMLASEHVNAFHTYQHRAKEMLLFIQQKQYV